MLTLAWLHQHIDFASVFLLLICLCIGSFLNVVIYRLPRSLMAQWHTECEQFLQQHPDTKSPSSLSLSWPASHCPHCQTPLRMWHNIPILSFLCLRGHCAFCQVKISWRYPIVEGSCLLVSAMVIYHFGLTPQAALVLVFSFLLLVMIFIDIEHQLLPDSLTMGLLWLGLMSNYFALFVSLHQAVLGALLGYLSLWSIMHLYQYLTGKQGMGHGDFKLFAALGAWLGWQALPYIIILASLTGIIFGSFILWRQQQDKNTPIAFGPYLAIAAWIMLLYGQSVNQFWQATLR